MTVRLTTLGRLLPAAVLLALFVCPAGGATAPAGPALPPAKDVRAHDRRSDDGSAIILEWPKPAELPAGAFYVIEVAKAADGFRTGHYVTQALTPGPGALKAADPKYFGYHKKNEGVYFAEIDPASLFLKPRLSPGRVRELVADGFLTDAEAARALDAIASRMLGEVLALQKRAEKAEAAAQGASEAEKAEKTEEARVAAAAAGAAEKAAKAEEKWLATVADAVHDRDLLKRFVAGKLLSDTDAARALRALGSFAAWSSPETDQAKADKKWLSGLWPLLSSKDLVARSLKRGVISQQHYGRAMAAFAIGAPDSDMTTEQKRDRRWLARLEAYLAEKQKDADKAEREKVNAATYYIRLAVSADEGAAATKAYVLRDGGPAVFSAAAAPNLFKVYKLNNLIFALLFSSVVMFFIQVARRNPNLFIRKISGLEAIEEAIGRATEMGRSVYFVHGLHDMGALPTIAAINVLARVVRRAAEYDTRVRVMNNLPIVTAVSQEVVQQAYTEAGRPDAYNPDDVSLVATDQFSYVAAVSGMMVREEPAAVFYMGYFYAESLLLAETGASTGAIQVAGTDAYTQLPFFVTTCDYTLMGEELYAASAYLSREPRLLGSLRGQDVGKALMMLALVLFTIFMTIDAALGGKGYWIKDLLAAF